MEELGRIPQVQSDKLVFVSTLDKWASRSHDSDILPADLVLDQGMWSRFKYFLWIFEDCSSGYHRNFTTKFIGECKSC